MVEKSEAPSAIGTAGMRTVGFEVGSVNNNSNWEGEGAGDEEGEAEIKREKEEEEDAPKPLASNGGDERRSFLIGG